MKRKQVEMTYLLYSQRPTNELLLQPAWLRDMRAASTATHAHTAPDQPFRMPYVDAECFPGTLAEYDIPVMPRWLHLHWWVAHGRTSLCRGNETRKIADECACTAPIDSPFIGSHWEVTKVPRRFDYHSVKFRL